MKFKLKELRSKKRWSKSKLSRVSGVSRSYISEIENGKYTPTVEVACKLAKALRCELTDLIICEEDEDVR